MLTQLGKVHPFSLCIICYSHLQSRSVIACPCCAMHDFSSLSFMIIKACISDIRASLIYYSISIQQGVQQLLIPFSYFVKIDDKRWRYL